MTSDIKGRDGEGRVRVVQLECHKHPALQHPRPLALTRRFLFLPLHQEFTSPDELWQKEADADGGHNTWSVLGCARLSARPSLHSTSRTHSRAYTALPTPSHQPSHAHTGHTALHRAVHFAP